jgi:transposase-like protein
MGRRRYTPQFKSRIVLEVLKEEKELGEIAAESNISPNQLHN